jgi:hypothetical protein
MNDRFDFPIKSSCIDIRGSNNELLGSGWMERAAGAELTTLQHWILGRGYRGRFRGLLAARKSVTMLAAEKQCRTRLEWRAHSQPLLWETGAEYVISAGRRLSSLKALDSSGAHAEPNEGGFEQVYENVAEIGVDIGVDYPYEQPHEPFGYVHTNLEEYGSKSLAPGVGPSFPGIPGLQGERRTERWVWLRAAPVQSIALRKPASGMRARLNKDFAGSLADLWTAESSCAIYSCAIFSALPPA